MVKPSFEICRLLFLIVVALPITSEAGPATSGFEVEVTGNRLSLAGTGAPSGTFCKRSAKPPASR